MVASNDQKRLGKDPTRNAWVDYLRGTSIILVLATHIASVLTAVADGPVWRLFVSSGYFGVCLFFVISGFLITQGIYNRFGTLGAISLRAFYANRARRILPGLLLTLTVLWILLKRSPGMFFVPDFGTRLWYVATFRYNDYRLAHGTGILAWDVLWSLSIEEMFYFFYPVLCRLLAPRRLLIPLLAVACVFGPLFRAYWHKGTEDSQFAFGGCVGLLALGCLTAVAAKSWAEPHGKRCASVLIGAGLAIIVASALWVPGVQRTLAGGFGAAVFLLGASRLQRVAPPARLRWLGFLPLLGAAGRLSYEIYLLHGYFAPQIYSAFAVQRVKLGNVWIGVACYVLAFVGVVSLASMLFARGWCEPLSDAFRSGRRGEKGAVTAIPWGLGLAAFLVIWLFFSVPKGSEGEATLTPPTQALVEITTRFDELLPRRPGPVSPNGH